LIVPRTTPVWAKETTETNNNNNKVRKENFAFIIDIGVIYFTAAKVGTQC
jgi:hypothetical protein